LPYDPIGNKHAALRLPALYMNLSLLEAGENSLLCILLSRGTDKPGTHHRAQAYLYAGSSPLISRSGGPRPLPFLFRRTISMSADRIDYLASFIFAARRTSIDWMWVMSFLLRLILQITQKLS